jgi:hypothetical protein
VSSNKNPKKLAVSQGKQPGLNRNEIDEFAGLVLQQYQ